jgi:hypothetical protein
MHYLKNLKKYSERSKVYSPQFWFYRQTGTEGKFLVRHTSCKHIDTWAPTQPTIRNIYNNLVVLPSMTCLLKYVYKNNNKSSLKYLFFYNISHDTKTHAWTDQHIFMI